MAESIYAQLDKQNVITPVNGIDYDTALPTGLFPTSEVFESPDKLVDWANENSFTAKLIQKGLQKAIIEVRACFKSCPKDEVWSEEMGIKNVSEMEWKAINRPNVGGSKAVSTAILETGGKIAQSMKGIVEDTQIIAILSKTYTTAEVEAIMATLTD